VNWTNANSNPNFGEGAVEELIASDYGITTGIRDHNCPSGAITEDERCESKGR
jgi:hypothetical protein